MSNSEKPPHEIIDADVRVPKGLILLNILATLVYITWWFDLRNAGILWLYVPLLIGEVYHVFQAIGYAVTIWNQKKSKKPRLTYFPAVDIFITVCGEPTEIIKRTVQAALNIDYPNFKVYVLNDGKGRNVSNWKEVNIETKKLGAIPFTRDQNIGAKAGNINNALKQTKAPFVAVFDADHIPRKSFLSATMPYFNDEKMALVQTPQYYANRNNTYLTTAAWEQQELFFGPICRGKNSMNATFWCGTNAVVRRQALEEIGGVPENNIAEDFLASLFMHKNGWSSVYVPQILAEGLAPHDLQNYVTQQFRWARGSSELMFKYNPILSRKLSFWQKLQYAYSSSYYLNGFIVLIDMLVPIIVLFTGLIPVADKTSSFIIFFLPFIFSTVYLLMSSTENSITFRAIQLSMSSSFVFIQAVMATLFGVKSSFKVTSKEAESGNFLRFAFPHITYYIVGFGAIIWSITNYGLTPSVITNSTWIFFNMAMLWGYIGVAYSWKLLPIYTKQFIFSFNLRKAINVAYLKVISYSKENLKHNDEPEL